MEIELEADQAHVIDGPIDAQIVAVLAEFGAAPIFCAALAANGLPR